MTFPSEMTEKSDRQEFLTSSGEKQNKMPKENKGLFQNQREAMGVKLEDSATRGQEGVADEGVSLARCQERARRALKGMTSGAHALLGLGDSSHEGTVISF